jgi:hypothetical protein
MNIKYVFQELDTTYIVSKPDAYSSFGFMNLQYGVIQTF